MKNQMIKLGSKIFGTLAFPGFAIAGNKHGSIELGVLLTLFGAPITFPCALVFGPIYSFFASKEEK